MILASQNYIQAFSYISTNFENRNEYIVDNDSFEFNDNIQSDLVNNILNLALLDEKYANEFEFGNRMQRHEKVTTYGKN